MYLGWFDDTSKKPILTKIDEAVERFTFRFGVAPAVCLVSAAELVQHPRVEVRAAGHVRPNYYFVGRDDMEALMLAESSSAAAPRPAVAAPKRAAKVAARVEPAPLAEVAPKRAPKAAAPV